MVERGAARGRPLPLCSACHSPVLLLNRFKRESIAAVARALRNAPEVKKIKDIFIQFDADGSGFISEMNLAWRCEA